MKREFNKDEVYYEKHTVFEQQKQHKLKHCITDRHTYETSMLL